MERAGAAAADMAAKLAGDRENILVLAGPGNNGGDARIAAARLEERFFRVKVVSHPRELPLEKSWGLVIDGLFGIGLARNITGDYAQLVEYVNRQRCPVLALDIPSGIQSDTGQRARLRGARDAHDHVHRAEAGPAHAGRPGPLRRNPGGGAGS